MSFSNAIVPVSEMSMTHPSMGAAVIYPAFDRARGMAAQRQASFGVPFRADAYSLYRRMGLLPVYCSTASRSVRSAASRSASTFSAAWRFASAAASIFAILAASRFASLAASRSTLRAASRSAFSAASRCARCDLAPAPSDGDDQQA